MRGGDIWGAAHRRGVWLVLVSLLVLGLTGCSSGGTSGAKSASSVKAHHEKPSPAQVADTNGKRPAAAKAKQHRTVAVRRRIAALDAKLVQVAKGHGWHGSHLDGKFAAAGTCRARHMRGQVLPDLRSRCTPGSVDAAVRPNTLAKTICRSGGYTSSVRPPAGITSRAKRQAMLSYGIAPGAASAYEYDHLVPLELGGSSAIANLWPERDIGGKGGFIRNAKDRVENALKHAVCSGRVPLGKAQHAIAYNWLRAGALVDISPSS